MIRLAQAVGAVCGSDWRLQPGDSVRQTGSLYTYGHAFTSDEIAAEIAAAKLRVVYRCDFPNEVVMALTPV